MRKYSEKADVQKKAYHSDRFRIAPQIQRFELDDVFQATLEEVKKSVEVKEAYVELEQMVIWIEPKDILKTLRVMKNDGYENLSEVSAVDFIAKKGGFEVFYQLLSMEKKKRSRIKCFLPKGEKIQSVYEVYKSADWAEREMYDMFGIICLNHPNFKRILMPDDWQGYPLLKTYPLQGDEAARWYEVDKLFGKEYREVIGEEQRDSARVNESDTKNFSRLNHAVPYATPMSEEETKQEYQEDGGVVIVKKVKKSDSKVIEGRR